jgi:hypothetical protein
MSAIVDKGLKAKRESKKVDFKRSFDPNVLGEWCEILKDIIAMANTGGGVILVGLENNGDPSGENIQAVLDLDHAVVVDKIRKYTGCDFSEIEIHETKKQGNTIAVIEVAGVKVPLVFQNAGSYEVGGKPKIAFARGTVYFRHGAKSEPGTTEDIRMVIDRQLESIRSEWMDGVRKVVTAPQGSAVSVFSGDVKESHSPNATPIRLVDDPDAPGYRLIDHDTTYPHRQVELINVINGMLPKNVTINTYDILAVRRTHNIDDDARFCHTPKFGSPQYSDAFAQWVVEQHKQNNNFFQETRRKHYAQTH